jgi:hypothetical protein
MEGWAMKDILSSWKAVVIASVLCICATAIVVAFIVSQAAPQVPKDRYRYETITKTGGAEGANGYLWKVDTETGEVHNLVPIEFANHR